MGFIKRILNAGNPEGGRDAMRDSYKKHVKIAQQRKLSNVHQIGLYGALASRYRVKWQQPVKPTEPEIWVELIPFLSMNEQESIEALAEYVLYKEWPVESKISWLEEKINKALLNISEITQEQKEIIQSRLKWYNFVNSENKKRLFKETKKTDTDYIKKLLTEKGENVISGKVDKNENLEIIIPQKYRKKLVDEVVIAPNIDGSSLRLFDKLSWDNGVSAYRKVISLSKSKGGYFKTINDYMINNARITKIKKDGKIIVPRNLKEFAKIKKEITLHNLENGLLLIMPSEIDKDK